MLVQQVEERGWCGKSMRRVAPSHLLAGLIIIMLTCLCDQKTMAADRIAGTRDDLWRGGFAKTRSAPHDR